MDDAALAASREQSSPGSRWRPSLFMMILAAVAAGILCGLFFGEYVGGLKIVGEAYVGLLQMTVLPYIVFALISSIGRLTLHESKQLAKVSIITLAVLWAIGCATVAAMSLSLPAREAGSFFSTQFIEPQKSIDFIQLFVPSNPFGSLANNVAPAVVVFCIMFGVALMKVERKQGLLEACDTVVTTLLRVNKFVASLSPIGIFAITAAAAGTLSLEEFSRLQAYLLVFALSALLLTFLVLPMLVAACTPFRYRDILSVSKNALITVFIIQSLFIVIPMLAEGIKRLAEMYEKKGIKPVVSPDFVIPIAYPFPHLGKVVTLIFIPFAGWFYGTAIPWTDLPLLLSTGLVLSFGKVVTTIPFLLDLQELPGDIFQLFLVSSVFAGGISDLIGAMHLIAFTVLTICALSGQIRFKRAKLLALVGLTVLIGGITVLSARSLLGGEWAQGPSGEAALGEMQLLALEGTAPSKFLTVSSPNPVPLEPGQSRLDRMKARGVIRIGYRTDDFPFSFLNARGELVGLDIDMAYNLAAEMGLGIEFVPIDFSDLATQLAADHFDIAFSGVAATTRRSLDFHLSETYMDTTLALIVPDHRKEAFSDLDSIRSLGAFSMGVRTGTFFDREINRHLPHANVVQLDSVRQFFENPPEPLEVLLFSAEGGSAWTLIYPRYSVVNPLSRAVRIPLAYAYGGPDRRFEKFLEDWIQLKRKDNTLDILYDHWILGKGAESQEPRWSVIRDVLGWVD